MGQDCSVQISNDLDIDIMVRLVYANESYLPSMVNIDAKDGTLKIGLEKVSYDTATDNILVEPGNKLKISPLNKIQARNFTWVIAYKDGDHVSEIQQTTTHEKLMVTKSKGGTVHVKKGETRGTCDEQLSVEVLMKPGSVDAKDYYAKK